MVEHKLVSFAAVVALCRTLEILSMKLIRKGKYRDDENYAILTLCFKRKAILFKKFSFQLPGLEYSYGKIFIRCPRDLGLGF